MARRSHAAFRRKKSGPDVGAVQPPAAGSPLRAAVEWRARACIALAIVAVFGRALPYPLLRSWDDGRFILDNADVQHPSFGALARMFGQQQFEAYHPLHLLSYWLDVPWFGPTPWVVHSVSLVLWVLAAWLLYGAFRGLVITPWPAVLGVLGCVIHPVQVEAVVWATGRKDVLALLFASASLWLHMRSTTGWDRMAWLSRAAYALALLSKTTTLPLPLVMIALDLCARRVRARDAVLRQLPSFVIAAAASFGTLQIWHENTMLRTNVGDASQAPLRFAQTLGHQLITAIWPAHTAPMYPTNAVIAFEAGPFVALGSWVLACVVAARRGARLALAGLISFGLLMLPVSNLVPMYFPLQDRYLSLPLAGLALALAGALMAVPAKEQRGLAILASLAIAALGVRGAQYTGMWQSDSRLWGHAASTQPDADYAWLKLGEVHRDAGDLEAAISAYQTAVHVAPLRKLAHAALFEAVALRDERNSKRSPSQARQFAQRYYENLGSVSGLQDLAGVLLHEGYARAVELPLQIIVSRQNLPDNALEKIARAQLREGRRSLARFYVASMRERTKDPELDALLGEFSFRVLP